ncbi:MAG: hypothetical protein H7A00_03555 [Hahellaceae bacterium]|nr:hypothetical protein [Hahellaceae bacterium]
MSIVKRNMIFLICSLCMALVALCAAMLYESVRGHTRYLDISTAYLERLGIDMAGETLVLKDRYPRILPTMLDVTTAKKMFHDEFGGDLVKQCQQKDVHWLVVCYKLGISAPGLAQLYQLLADFKVQVPTLDDQASNAWELAVLYDQVASERLRFPASDNQIRMKLKATLDQYLKLLQRGSGASLWHGRFTLSCHAWIIAIVIGDDKPILLKRAFREFKNALDAISLTEGWPEGYNYWINNRAFPFALASAAYLAGIVEGPDSEALQSLLRRVIRWHIYMTRPDHKIDAIGDEGPRVDLKDETRKFIDLATKLSSDPIGATYSAYLFNLHRQESYYADYRWLFPLIKSYVRPLADPGKSLSVFTGVLPLQEVFGRNYYNQIVMLQGWGDQDTQIRVRAGDQFTHHQPADVGHFTLFNGRPLISDGSTYSTMFTENRLYYGVQTVAKNSLLVIQPNQHVVPSRLYKRDINSGGQRLIMPTGSSIDDLAFWQRNLYKGLTLKRATLLRSSFNSGVHVVDFDMTLAYPNTRISRSNAVLSEAHRAMIYISAIDKLLIKDSVVLEGSGALIKQVFHVAKPPLESLNRGEWIKGDPLNGLWQSGVNEKLTGLSFQNLELTAFVNEQSNGFVSQPNRFIYRAVGGETYRHWVEFMDDAGQRQAMYASGGYAPRGWFDDPAWRVEIEPQVDSRNLSIITVLGINRDQKVEQSPAPQLIASNGYLRMDFGDQELVVFGTASGNQLTHAIEKKTIVVAPENTTKVHLSGTNTSMLLTHGIGFVNNVDDQHKR